MKKSMLGVVSGLTLAQLLLLGTAGCRTEVMNAREFVPADGSSREAVPPAESAPPAAALTPELPPPPAPELLAEPEPAPAPAVTAAPAPQAKPSFPRMDPFPDTPKPTNDRARRGGSSAPKATTATTTAAPAATAGTYVVKSGDTLGHIALRHRVRLRALMEANKLTEADARKLQVGQKLVIPGGAAAAVSGTSSRSSDRTAPRSKGAAEVVDGVYVVKAGDNVSTIAIKLGLKRAALMKANNLTEASARRLQIGQKLVIPGAEVKAAATAPSPAVTSTPGASASSEAATAPTAPTEVPPVQLDGGAPVSLPLDETGSAAPVLPPATGVEGVPVQPPAAGAETTGTSLVTTSELTDVTPVSITEEITIEDFTKKYEISVQVFQELNKNDLPKDGKLKAGDVFFIPSK